MSEAYNTIRAAMLLGKPVSLTYAGHYREVCAHVIGLNKNGREQALTYQYGGSSSSGLPPDGEWRCMMLGNARDVKIIEGAWSTGQDHNQTQTCVDQIDVELWVDESGKPYVKRA
jgi:hypothetical protein